MTIPGSAHPLLMASLAGPEDYQIQRSLRFNSADSSHLSKTFSSAGNRKTWTWSGWVKRSKLGTSQFFFETRHGSSDAAIFSFGFADGTYGTTKDALTIFRYSFYNFITTQLFRDTSAWYHIVLSADTTQSTASNRLKIYVNGVQVTDFNSATYPSLNEDLPINTVNVHKIGGGSYLDGYLADVHFIDGQALAPTDFGEFDDNNVWQPKEFSGTYGTNGFHLDFSDNSSNAALGYDAAGSNDWTVNNLDHTENTPFQKIDALGTVTSANGYTLTNVVNAFDAATNFLGTTWSSSGVGNADTITWTPGSNITVPSGYNLYFAIYYKTTNNNNRFFRFTDANGTDGTEVAVSSSNYSATTNYWTDVTSALPTAEANGDRIFSAFRYRDTVAHSGQYPRWYSVVIATSPPDSYNAPSNVTYLIDNSLGNPVNSGCDSLVDTPTNYGDDTGAGGEVRGNYCTWNPLDKGSVTLSNGNLDVVTSTTWQLVRGTIGVSSGKWYWEYTMTAAGYTMLGMNVADPTMNIYAGYEGYAYYSVNGYKYNNNTSASYGATFTTNDVIGVAFDADSGKIWFAKNGTWQASGDPASGTNAAYSSIPAGTYFPTTSQDNGGGATGGSTNFGQRPFAYTAPSGFNAINTASLPEPTIADGSAYMDVVTYTGDGSSSERTITGLSLASAPDLIWVKNRSDGSGTHLLWDAVRGGSLNLSSDDTGQEYPLSSWGYGAITGNAADGIKVQKGSLANAYHVNENNDAYVAWTWDAGANSSKTYAVTVVSDSGNKYRFDGHGTSAVTLDLEEGSTYTFDQSDSSNAGHPLRFSTTSDGTHGGGSEYTTGVTTVGTPGSAGAKTTIVVASGAPTLYYYCSVHSGMGGQVNTNSTAGATVLSGSLNSSVYDQSAVFSNNVTSTSGSFYSGRPPTNLFDGSTATLCDPANQSGVLTFTPSSAISYSSSVEVYVAAGCSLSLNGGTSITSVTGWNTIATGSGSVTSIAVSIPGFRPNWSAVRIDGKLLVDSGVSVTNVPSINSVVRANPTAGFSIVTYTGNNTNSTVAHGLNAAPGMVIVKNRDQSYQWTVYHDSLDADKCLFLNSTVGASAGSAAPQFNSSKTTSTTFPIGAGGNTNYPSGSDLIAYCFAPVEGYSAIDSFTGNGSTDGPFVYTGFKPAFIIMKNVVGNDWYIYDYKREAEHNPSTKPLYPNGSYAEQPDSRTVDILSNGFKVRYNQFINPSNVEVVYMAFASNPFSLNGGMAR